MSHRILSSVGKPSAAETLAFSEERAQPRIGAEFQIPQHELKLACDSERVESDYGEWVWSSRMAEASSSTVIFRKEVALELFHQNNYCIDGEYCYT